jgi:hypothetical protein
MTVQANRGIPPGITVALTERQEIFRLLADRLMEKGFPRDHVAMLPLRSDEGAAFKNDGGDYREFRFCCARDLRDAVESGMFVAMLHETMCDFQAGCSAGFTTVAAEKKFRGLFGLGIK